MKAFIHLDLDPFQSEWHFIVYFIIHHTVP